MNEDGYRDDVEELLEAIRLTQEYAQLPALEGWTWYDTYRKYRPKDAERLRAYWQLGVDNGAWRPTSGSAT